MTDHDPLAAIKQRGYDAQRAAHNRHYQRYLSQRGLTYDHFEPGYRFGYDMAFDVTMQDRYWAEIESKLHARWDEEQEGEWDDHAANVRHAWESTRRFNQLGNEERYRYIEPAFRRHHEAFGGAEGQAYEEAAAVYRLGYELAHDPAFLYHDWPEIEASAGERWSEIGSGDWKSVSETVRQAMEAVRRSTRLLEFNQYETTFRRHYQTHYATVGGHDFDWYQPAYRYGYDLAMDQKYAGNNWYGVESDAQRRWEERGSHKWEEVQEGVRRAWHEVKSALGVDDPYDVTFSALRRQYDDRYANMGYPQDENYEPGYRYGYFLAADTRYRDKEWSEVAADVTAYWQENPVGSLENFRMAAQDAWNEVKSELNR